MYEILKSLQSGALVLDVGSAQGSFPTEATSATVIRIDREAPPSSTPTASFVQGDAVNLPFRDRTFALVIANHSLEHFEDLRSALIEIGRVISCAGCLFVTVPDASTLTDRLYRWLARGGGHVNAFTSATEIATEIERLTGLPLVATRLLCSSLSFLNHRDAPRPLPRRLLLLGGGSEWSLFLYNWISRALDRHFNLRTSIYGWAFYFGTISESVDTDTWTNVCLRCGGGHATSTLIQRGAVRPSYIGLSIYLCPVCGATNPFVH